MKTFLMQGVPNSVRQDGCWLSDAQVRRTPPPINRGAVADGGLARIGLLIVLIALGDVLVWQVVPRLSLAVFCAALVLGALMVTPRRLRGQQLAIIAGLTLLILLPLIELMQPLALMLAVAGLSAVLAIAARLRPGQVPRCVCGCWGYARRLPMPLPSLVPPLMQTGAGRPAG